MIKFVQSDFAMSNAAIRSTLHQEIDKSDDRLLNMIYALIQAYNPATAGTDAERQRLILQERENYLRGEGKNYSWDQVKKMARNTKPPAHGV